MHGNRVDIYDVFISYSSKDRERVASLVDRLKNCNLKVFYDQDEVKKNLGGYVFDSIEKALENSRHFVWVCTSNSLNSADVKLECYTFFHTCYKLDQTRRMIILNEDSLDRSLIPLFYRNLQMADNHEQISAVLAQGGNLPIFENAQRRRVNKGPLNFLAIVTAVFSAVFIFIFAWPRLSHLNGRETIPPQANERKQNQHIANASGNSNSGVFEMILVKGGKYNANDNLGGVNIKPFSIGATEVTQKQWVGIMNNNPSIHKCDDCPVENISLLEIMEFIDRLNQHGTKYRLPTIYEWEFAAKGGIGAKYTKYPGSNSAPESGWFKENCDGKTHPIKQKTANILGLYDMAGNVAEWTISIIDERDHITLHGSGRDRNLYIIAGFSFENGYSAFVYKNRDIKAHPDYRDKAKGFRLAMDAQQ